MREGVVVEEGATADVLSHPSHPYTRRLLRAIPSGLTRGYRLAPPENEPEARIPLPEKRIETGHKVLEGVDLVKHYPGGDPRKPAVSGVSFDLAAGEALGIVGESGSGKTTLSRIVLGLIAPDSGRVLLDGAPWSELTEAKRRGRRAGIQLIAQDTLGSFDPRYDVERIIGESLDSVGVFGSARKERVFELLDAVRLGAGVLRRNPRELSGGQRQRVAIARAFAPRPKLLVADEPVSALDVSVQAQVLDLLAELQARSGPALLFISHDLGVVHHLVDRVVVMKDGEAVETGEVNAIFARPRHSYTRALIGALAPSCPLERQTALRPRGFHQPAASAPEEAGPEFQEKFA
jgi:peptide/nickel transport system ATP-binding protein